MTAETIDSSWMFEPITAEQYDAMSEEQCRNIEIVEGLVHVSPKPTRRQNRLARRIADGIVAEAGIPYYWRVENAEGEPVVHTYKLDRPAAVYRSTGVHEGEVKTDLGFPVTVDLSDI